jgi:hypothetical protein
MSYGESRLVWWTSTGRIRCKGQHYMTMANAIIDDFAPAPATPPAGVAESEHFAKDAPLDGPHELRGAGHTNAQTEPLSGTETVSETGFVNSRDAKPAVRSEAEPEALGVIELDVLYGGGS